MSKKIQFISITPPKLLHINACERYISEGYTCSYCNGNGYFWVEDSTGERVKEPCRVCGGSKRLKAIITVEWHAEK